MSLQTIHIAETGSKPALIRSRKNYT